MSLSPERTALLETLEQERSVEEVCASSATPDFEICRTLWAFDVIGFVRRTDTPPAEAGDDEGLGLLLSSE